jgi:hypothetical protein
MTFTIPLPRCLCSALILAGLALSAGAAPAPLRVYFVGNSLTMSLTLDRVHALCAQRGIDLQFGSQLSGGKTLIRHLRYRSEPDQQWSSWETNVPQGGTFVPDPNHWQPQPLRFGRHDRALVEHMWDALVLQLHGPNLHDELLAVRGFLELANRHDSARTVYLYSAWPFRPRPGGGAPPRNIDYGALWQAPYTAAATDTTRAAAAKLPSRSYVDRVFRELAPAGSAAGRPLRLIPVGEVLFEVDRRLKAGELPGVGKLARRSPAMVPGLGERATPADGVNVLYADHIHFNPVPHKTAALGIFIGGTTVQTVLTGRNPAGLSGAPYGLDDPRDAALVAELQRIVWSVVTADPRTGVKP